jgi:hypothetical protein
MSEEKAPHENDRGQVLPFTPRRAPKPPPTFSGWLPAPKGSPVDGIGKYERPEPDYDDYRHRMTVNAAAFVFLILLVIVGTWLAIKIAELRRDQDCILSGRRNCAQISIINPK